MLWYRASAWGMIGVERSSIQAGATKVNTRKQTNNTDNNQPLTFGDLCEALADRDLPAIVEDGDYVVFQGDLKRFLQPNRAASSVPTMLAMLMHNPIQMAG